jgi:serine/threonine protein kinase
MELLKTEYSENKGNGKLDKVLLKYEETNYYKLTEFLYTSQNEQAIVLKALYECEINVVLKFGILESIEKEYYKSQELLDLPNFIRYFCLIKCDDNIKNIINNKNTISNYKMCHYGDNQIGILVMKEYNLGSIENYIWNENNFQLLKNVIKQVIFSIIYAYNNKGFIHGDLHSGNILLKPKRNCEIKYDNKTLIIEEFEVVIMDFEKSKLHQKNKITDLIKNILKFITSIISTCLKNDLIINIDINKVIKLKSIFIKNIDYYNELEKIINDIILN